MNMTNVWLETVLLPTDLDEETGVVTCTEVKVSRVPLLKRYWREVASAGYITSRDLVRILGVIDRTAPEAR